MNARGWQRLGNVAMDDESLTLDTGRFTTTRTTDFYLGGTQVTSSAAELNIMDGVTATATEINQAADQSGMLIATGAGVGITGGTGTIYKQSLTHQGQLHKYTIYLDITGLGSSTTDLDVIGVAGGPAHLGRIIAVEVGTVEAVLMTCLELPAGGVTDIDLYSATVGTAVFDDGIAALTETAIITSGGAWANGTQKAATTVPPANDYLYLTCGAGGVPGTYTAGKFLIEVWGY